MRVISSYAREATSPNFPSVPPGGGCVPLEALTGKSSVTESTLFATSKNLIVSGFLFLVIRDQRNSTFLWPEESRHVIPCRNVLNF